MRSRYLLALSILLSAPASQALCPAPAPKLCAAFFESDQVFVGKVVARDFVAGDDPDGANWILYTVEVERVFRGQAGGVEQVLTENSSGRWTGEIGRSYLVFVTGGRTGATCSSLDEPKSETEAAREIHALSTATRSTIEGEVVQGGGGRGAPGAGSERSLHIAGPDGILELTTDEAGHFRIEVLPGRYRLLPGDLAPTAYSRQDLDNIELVPGQCAQFQLGAPAN